MKSDQQKYTFSLKPQQVLQLKDMASAIEYGSVTADRRVQVVMPALVVEALDQLFPETDRSRVLTQLALEAILEKLRFSDRPDLAEIVRSEQSTLTNLDRYLSERERS